jgi:hypothetical protein
MSKLHRIDECAFQKSDLKTIEIPASVEVVCKSCFSTCTLLTSVTFESISKLHRIKAFAFQGSDLTQLLLPNSIRFLSGSAFASSSLKSISFWPGQSEFQVSDKFIEDIAGQSRIRYFGKSIRVVIKSKIEIVSEFCFSNCRSLTSVTFESKSKFQRIEECAFHKSDLITIEIPASVEAVCRHCFSYCTSFISVTFR